MKFYLNDNKIVISPVLENLKQSMQQKKQIGIEAVTLLVAFLNKNNNFFVTFTVFYVNTVVSDYNNTVKMAFLQSSFDFMYYFNFFFSNDFSLFSFTTSEILLWIVQFATVRLYTILTDILCRSTEIMNYFKFLFTLLQNALYHSECTLSLYICNPVSQTFDNSRCEFQFVAISN